jgi:hypothetical protein
MSTNFKHENRWEPGLNTFVYVIGETEDGPVKVGISNNPLGRLVQLQTGHHGKLRLLALARTLVPARKVERALHTVLRDERMKGEWFDVPLRRVFYETALAEGTATHGEVRWRPDDEESSEYACAESLALLVVQRSGRNMLGATA